MYRFLFILKLELLLWLNVQLNYQVWVQFPYFQYSYYFCIFNHLSDVLNKVIRSSCSFFDNIKEFPVVDIVDIIEIDQVNKILLKGCLVPLFPHEYMVKMLLLILIRLYSTSTWDDSITLKIKFSVTAFGDLFVQSIISIIEKEFSSKFDNLFSFRIFLLYMKKIIPKSWIIFDWIVLEVNGLSCNLRYSAINK